jgi:hypothetical protein
MKAEASKQVTPPELRNPNGKGGFKDHPENRSDGRWDKDNSFSYWFNYFKSLSVEDFKKYETTKTDKERSMAETLAYARVFKARSDLKEFQEVANRTEGMPKQPIEHSGEIGERIALDEKTKAAIKKFVELAKKKIK